jgi:hypothetical protein
LVFLVDLRLIDEKENDIFDWILENYLKKINFYHKEIIKNILTRLNENNQILFVFDAYDESERIYSKLKNENIFYQIINEENLFKNMIIFTRPEYKILPKHVTLNLSISGFSENEIEKFKNNYFKKQIEMIENKNERKEKMEIIDNFISNKNLEKLINTPLYLEMVCMIIEKCNENLFDNKIDKIGDLFFNLTKLLIHKRVEDFYLRKKTFQFIQTISFQIFMKNKFSFSILDFEENLDEIFKEDKIESRDKKMKLAQKIFENLKVCGLFKKTVYDQIENSFFLQFVHFSIQEYFCASFIFEKLCDQQNLPMRQYLFEILKENKFTFTMIPPFISFFLQKHEKYQFFNNLLFSVFHFSFFDKRNAFVLTN